MTDDESDGDPRPRDIDAERAVLGAMMLSCDAAATAAATLTAEDFYRPAHGVVFAAITGLLEDGEPVGPIAVGARLRRDGDEQRVGGAPHLLSLYESAVGTDVGYHADLVAAAAARARLIDASQRLAQLANAPGELAEVQEQARATVDDATRRRDEGDGGVWAGDVVDDEMASWDQPQESGLAWPYADVDDLLGGMRPGQLIVVAARPGIGKSTALMDGARHAAGEGVGVLFASLEMTRGELVMRLTCAEARVRMTEVKSRQVSPADRLRLKGAAERIADMPLRIEDRPNMTLGQLRAAAREQARGPRGLGLLVLDYVQLLTPVDSRVSRREQVDGFSRGLKQLAKELGVPAMVAAQLNRGPESRSDKKPQLSDLRESGGLEQDPDIVVLLNRPDAFEREDPRAGEADLIVAKHRGGPTGTVTLAHQLHFCRFSDLARGERWSAAG